MHHNGLYKAIRYFGSQKALADAIGVSQQAISLWINRTRSVPFKQILKIISVTQGFVTQHDLAPQEREMNSIFDDVLQMQKISPHSDSLTSPNNSEQENQRLNNLDDHEHDDLDYYYLILPLYKLPEKELILTNKEEKIMMRDYSKISPQFWVGRTGREIRELGIESRMIAIYLLSCPHSTMLGVYYLPIEYIVHDTKINKDGVVSALQKLISIGFCSYDDQAEYIWVHEMAKHQICEYLHERDKRVKAVNDIYHSLPDLIFINNFFEKYKDIFHLQTRQNKKLSRQENILDQKPTTNVVNENNAPFEGASKALRSQEQDQEQKQEQEQEQEKEQEIKQKQKEKRIDMSGKPDVDHLVNFDSEQNLIKKNLKPTRYQEALEVLEFLNEKTNRVYRPVSTNLTLIISCLRSGATVEQCRQVIAKKCREWKKDSKMIEYLRPATLFNPVKFEQYLGELVLPNRACDDESN